MVNISEYSFRCLKTERQIKLKFIKICQIVTFDNVAKNIQKTALPKIPPALKKTSNSMKTDFKPEMNTEFALA